MAKLHHLKISHFRGIESFEQQFGNGITCIIGRGDSGKSTILDAIAYVFSQSWSVHLNDSDFTNCDTDTPIIVEGTVIDVSADLIAKYGKHLRGVLPNGLIIDDMEAPEAADAQTALTIQLKVGKDLEPIWSVISYNGEEPSIIKATDRGKLNVFAVSDYTDRHFSLNKGNPLYNLYKQLNGAAIEETDNVVLDVVRDAKKAFDDAVGDNFNAVITKVKTIAATLGITLNEMKAMLDHRDIAISENKVSIHEDGVPFRLKGKGSKRLLSLAIQLALTEPSGIILIDEIEQGLEPDRVMHLVNVLAENKDRQIIITTHSNCVLVELPCTALYIMRKGASGLLHVEGELQDCIRKIPEAFFAAKVLVCEGATEVGFCKALDAKRRELGRPSAACKGVFIADGSGNNMKSYAPSFRALGYPTALFCDSDPGGEGINDKKPEFVRLGIQLIDCEDSLAFEDQIFKDVPWAAVKELLAIAVLNLRKKANGNPEQSIIDCTNSFLGPQIQMENLDALYDHESPELRTALGQTAKKDTMKWFKRQDYGEMMGNVILAHYDELPADCRLKWEIDELSNWMDA